MKLIIFTPADHFHSPIILRELGVRKNYDITIVTTPKLGNRLFLYELSRIIKQSGFDYLFSMIITKITYSFFGIIERFLLKRPFLSRRFLSVSEVINHFSFHRLHFSGINSPKNIAILKNLKPDIIITAFFNRIINKEIISLARYGAINMHPSYLPLYRGISPCLWVLANNERFTGVSFHYLTPAIDEGPIIWQEKINIKPHDSFFNLYRHCAVKGAENIGQVLNKVQNGDKGIRQDGQKIRYFSTVTPKTVRLLRRNHHKFAWLI